MVFFFIRSILAGVFEPEIDNKEKLRQKLKDRLSYTLIFSFAAVASTTYHNPISSRHCWMDVSMSKIHFTCHYFVWYSIFYYYISME